MHPLLVEIRTLMLTVTIHLQFVNVISPLFILEFFCSLQESETVESIVINIKKA